MNIKKGKFIVFEGPDGVGKTTIGLNMSFRMKKDNIPCIFTREPGGTDLAEDIRNTIFEYGPSIDKSSQLYLFHAARIIHFLSKIKPALDAGINVICDRHYLSTVVYQQNVKDVVSMTRSLLTGYEDLFYTIILNPDDISILSDRLDNREDEGHENSYDDINKLEEYTNTYSNLFLNQDKLDLIGDTYIVDVCSDLNTNIDIIYYIIKEILKDE